MLLDRTAEIAELDKFETQSGAGLVYVRGRRRVGKSWLLRAWVEKRPKDRFYFSGALDASSAFTLTAFAEAWAEFSNDTSLTDLKKDRLNWNRIFTHIEQFSHQRGRKIILILDEIQWMAKQGNGFIGALKAAWVNFERRESVSVIICGSSNRFFATHVGGEEKILRGLQTRSTIWVNPLSLKQTRENVLPSWSPQEIATAYMILGGIPYYFKQLASDSSGFIHAMNKALFSAETNFLTEVDEVLGIEFNKAGLATVKKILRIMAVHGATQAEVCRRTKLASSTVSETVARLVDYEILYQEKNLYNLAPREPRYKINDFYLNFYFMFLERNANAIKRNTDGYQLLFTQKILKHKNFYIEGFSGYAFENLLRHCLTQAPAHVVLLRLLRVRDQVFEIGTYNDSTSQVDILIWGTEDRIVRVLECKWGAPEMQWIDALALKKIELPQNHTRADYLVLDSEPSTVLKDHAQRKKITLISLNELIEL